MMTTKRIPRRCQICHEPERSDGIYTTIAPHWGICADSINRYVLQRPEPKQRKRVRA